MINFKSLGIQTTLAAAALSAATIAVAPAQAENTRPVVGADLSSLQTLFDDITVSGPQIDAVNDQTTFSAFTNDASGGSVASFMFELAGFAQTNKFGLYSLSNPSNRAVIFDGINDPGDQSLISFLANGDLEVTVNPNSPGYNAPGVSYSLYTGFGNQFGFYIETQEGNIFYSDDSLNPNGDAQALIYQGNGETELQIPGLAAGEFDENEWIIAFEDLVFQASDKDFDDLVVMIESIDPVKSTPEPMTLLGLGLVGAAIAGTRRKSTKS